MNPWAKLERFYRRKSASAVCRRMVRIDLARPLISFTFDDFPRSALAEGGAILKRFGAVGTYYVSLGLEGKQEPSGQMYSIADLELLAGQGHELGCHTFSHCHAWDTEPDLFEESIIENRNALSRILPGVEFKSFSYPIALPRPATKAKVAKHFRSCRGGGQTTNSGSADLNQLSAFFLEKSRDDLEKIRNLIDYNRQVRGWLIFATHDICGQPSPYGCRPEFFTDVVRYALESGARILPVDTALQTICQTS